MAHEHYFKDCPYDTVDVYRVLQLFGVTDPCIQHAIKKLLVAGGRGSKDIEKDVKESIDSLNRFVMMRAEERGVENERAARMQPNLAGIGAAVPRWGMPSPDANPSVHPGRTEG